MAVYIRNLIIEGGLRYRNNPGDDFAVEEWSEIYREALKWAQGLRRGVSKYRRARPQD